MNFKSITAMLLTTLSASLSAQVVKVEVKQANGQWSLYRNGEPYYVKGGGGQVHLDELVNIGGNSIRTWSLNNAEEFLDNAHKKGLTVMMGLWVQHERHGFDYDDTVAVRKQLDFFRKRINQLKNHPALLMWGVGNEVDLFYTNTKVWNAVQDIAKMIHEEDPNHPTSTVTAGLDSMEVALVMKNAPDIDIYCVNTYSDLDNAVKNIAKFGWTGPYLITEWGPNGHWEVNKTAWAAPIEQSSSEKAMSYKARYASIEKASKTCLGSYVFLWGQKQETTSTWYGLFAKSGESSEVLDVLHSYWKKQKPENNCPTIGNFGIETDSSLSVGVYISSGIRYKAKADFMDADGDKLKVKWTVVKESTDIKAGGDAENEPPHILGLVKKNKGNNVEFIAPSEEGAYRLFVKAYDKNGHYAYANSPFYVKNSGVEPIVKLRKKKLNFLYE